MPSNQLELKKHVPYVPGVSPLQAARDFYGVMCQRRSVRMFSDQPVSRDVIASIVRSATSAPSGANKQPWRFVCIQDPVVKRAIREGAEAEERAFYEGRAPTVWLDDLAPLGTDANKSFLETAPWLIAVFRLTRLDDGSQVYYSNESVGIATGFLLAAAHHAGLATLTHTPSPMGFLRDILKRPEHEKPFLLIPMGYPSDNCEVPVAGSVRRPLEEVCLMVEG